MKALLIILGTFALALAATLLLDIAWIAHHWVRTGLVYVLVACILAAGAVVFVGSFKNAPAGGKDKSLTL